MPKVQEIERKERAVYRHSNATKTEATRPPAGGGVHSHGRAVPGNVTVYLGGYHRRNLVDVELEDELRRMAGALALRGLHQ